MVEIEEIRNFVKGKQIALIGNSQSLLKQSYGELIDSHDIIIRLNAGWIINPDAQGSKTDILFVSAPLGMNDIMKKMNPKYIVWATQKKTNHHPSAHKYLFDHPNEFWYPLFEELGSRPSSGMIAANFLARHTDCSVINMFGFDFFRTKTFYHNKPIADKHNGDAERKVVEKLELQGRIKVFNENKMLDQYKQLHKKQHYGASSEQLLDYIKPAVESLQPKTIVDYGCGKSRLLDWLKINDSVSVHRYDPAIPEFDNPPVEKQDLVICTDVMEHIPEDEVDSFLMKIKKLTDNTVFSISIVPAHTILPNGENAHCTVRPKEWWINKLEKYWNKTWLMDSPRPSKFLCRTFELETDTVDKYDTSDESLELHLKTWLNFEKQKPKRDLIHNLVGKDWSGTILDVGAGIGHFSQILELPNATYTGIEKCPKFIAEGKNRFSTIDLREGNAYSLDLADNNYDLVICNALLIHLSEPEKVIQELVRVSKKWIFLTVMEGDANQHHQYVGDSMKKVGYQGKDLEFTYHTMTESELVKSVRNATGKTEVIYSRELFVPGALSSYVYIFEV